MSAMAMYTPGVWTRRRSGGGFRRFGGKNSDGTRYDEGVADGTFRGRTTRTTGTSRRVVRTRLKVKGHPDSPMRDFPEWAPPPGIPAGVWSMRMNILADMVVGDGDEQVVVADVACGHGLLATGLMCSQRVAAAIGIDRSAPEVKVAREKVLQAQEAMGMENGQLAVDIRLGDGAAPLTLEDDVSTLVIAGLGGKTMMKILTDLDLGTGDLESVGARVNHLVLNPPAKDAADIRAYLLAPTICEAWVIDDERLCVENEQMHIMISARRSSSSQSPQPPPLPPSSSSSSSSNNDDITTTTDDNDDDDSTAAAAAAAATNAEVWRPFGAASSGEADDDALVEGTSRRWKPNAGDVIQWVGVKGDVLDLEKLADEVVGPVLRRRRPPLLTVYLRDRLEWTEGKRRAAKLKLAKISLERRVTAAEGDETHAEEEIEAMNRKETAVKEEVRRLGAIVSVMASLLGELELEQYLR